MSILLWVMVVFGLALVGMLVLPVRFRAHLRSAPALAYRLEVRALAGLAPTVVLVDSARPSRRRQRVNAPRKRGRTKGPATRPRVWTSVPRLIRGLIGAICLEYLNIEAEIGLPDPADTGRVYGYLVPLEYGACGAPRCSVSVRPHFAGPLFAGEADAAARVAAISLVPPILRFIWEAFGPGK